MLQPLPSASILLFNLQNSIILYNMSKTIPKMQDIQQQQMFSYIFT